MKNFTPVRLTSTVPAVDPKTTGRIPLFYVDDTEYSIPVEVPGNLALQAVDMTAKQGEPTATAWVMEQVLGEEGYAALLKAPMTKAEAGAIQKVIRDLVFGEPEDSGKG